MDECLHIRRHYVFCKGMFLIARILSVVLLGEDVAVLAAISRLLALSLPWSIVSVHVYVCTYICPETFSSTCQDASQLDVYVDVAHVDELDRQGSFHSCRVSQTDPFTINLGRDGHATTICDRDMLQINPDYVPL